MGISLLVLDLDKKVVSIRVYDRESFNQAESDYSAIEKKKTTSGKRLEPVLVSAGPIDKLRNAYPNFFLDIKKFESAIRKIVRSV